MLAKTANVSLRVSGYLWIFHTLDKLSCETEAFKRSPGRFSGSEGKVLAELLTPRDPVILHRALLYAQFIFYK